jgi:hypothetical protein
MGSDARSPAQSSVLGFFVSITGIRGQVEAYATVIVDARGSAQVEIAERNSARPAGQIHNLIAHDGIIPNLQALSIAEDQHRRGLLLRRRLRIRRRHRVAGRPVRRGIGCGDPVTRVRRRRQIRWWHHRFLTIVWPGDIARNWNRIRHGIGVGNNQSARLEASRACSVEWPVEREWPIEWEQRAERYVERSRGSVAMLEWLAGRLPSEGAKRGYAWTGRK